VNDILCPDCDRVYNINLPHACNMVLLRKLETIEVRLSELDKAIDSLQELIVALQHPDNEDMLGGRLAKLEDAVYNE
jgi:hypothetical protein